MQCAAVTIHVHKAAGGRQHARRRASWLGSRLTHARTASRTLKRLPNRDCSSTQKGRRRCDNTSSPINGTARMLGALGSTCERETETQRGETTRVDRCHARLHCVSVLRALTTTVFLSRLPHSWRGPGLPGTASASYWLNRRTRQPVRLHTAWARGAAGCMRHAARSRRDSREAAPATHCCSSSSCAASALRSCSDKTRAPSNCAGVMTWPRQLLFWGQ